MKPVLTTHHLDIGYAPPRRPVHTVASDLNLTLRTGELVCLLGPNGAGKSTLIRTLAGMHPPLAGRVMLADTDLALLNPRDLARRLSVVLTERIDVGTLAAYALVALGRHPYTDWLGRLTPQDEMVVRRSIEAVGAVSLAHRPVHELSDGERQRVMIARALAQEPLVMILDEPTAFLDLPRRVEMIRLLRRLAHTTGRAFLLSTHDLDLALRSADVLWLMDAQGQVAVGAPEDLILSGAFKTTFHREGVVFDEQTGAFQINAPTRLRVHLQGEGLPAIWTARALERAGFGIAEPQQPALLQIAVEHTAGQFRWHSSLPNQQQTCSTLYELVAFVRQTAATEHSQFPPEHESS